MTVPSNKVNTNSTKPVKNDTVIETPNIAETKPAPKVETKPKPIPQDVIDSMRHIDLKLINNVQSYIYNTNKEAFDLFFSLDKVASNNKLAQQE